MTTPSRASCLSRCLRSDPLSLSTSMPLIALTGVCAARVTSHQTELFAAVSLFSLLSLPRILSPRLRAARVWDTSGIRCRRSHQLCERPGIDVDWLWTKQYRQRRRQRWAATCSRRPVSSAIADVGGGSANMHGATVECHEMSGCNKRRGLFSVSHILAGGVVT